MAIIIPSPISNDPNEIKNWIEQCEDLVEKFQIDIIDGEFAANKTVDPSVFSDLESSLRLDYHLMVRNPIDWVERCVRGMAERIIGQIEMMESQIEFIGKVQATGCKVGLALDIETPLGALDKEILTDLDTVLILNGSAGFGGQPFDKRALGKIKELNELRKKDDTPFSIISDIGITPENAKEIVEAGADELAIGIRLFERDLKTNLEEFEKEIKLHG